MDSTQDLVPPGDAFVANVLVRAMLTADTRVSIKCCLALHAQGATGVTAIQDVAEGASLTLSKQRRLQKALGVVRSAPFQGDVRAVVVDALLGVLQGRTKAIRTLATRALEWCGPAIADELIAAAIGIIENSDGCTHLLRAALECGYQPSTAVLTNLRTQVMRSRNGGVHGQAARLTRYLPPDAAPHPDTIATEGRVAPREPQRLVPGRRRR